MKRNIIITGTSRGIGFELALQFANAGYQVLAISRKTPQALLGNQNITCLSVDLSKENELTTVANFISQMIYDDDIIIKRDWNKDGLYTNPNDINGPRVQLLTTIAIGFGYKF